MEPSVPKKEKNQLIVSEYCNCNICGDVKGISAVVM